jgi:hypothetical protein
MKISINRFLIAGMLLGMCQGASAGGKEAAGYDVQHSEALQGVPVEVVILNDRLRSQIAYQVQDVNYAQVQQATENALGPAAYSTAGVAAGALGSALGNAIANAIALQQAEKVAKPADAALKAAQCDLAVSDELAGSVEQTLRDTPWGATATVNRHVLSGEQGLDDVVAKNSSRYVIALSYSMSPDFSAVMTTATALAYSQAIPGAPEHWQKKPAWVDEVVVVSNQMALAPKTDADVQRALAVENARYAATGADDLIAKANGGDDVARKHAVPLADEHRRLLHDANGKKWSASSGAYRRSELWSENQCGPLREALQANNADVVQTLKQLFAGQMPAPVSAKRLNINSLLDGETAGERRVIAIPGNLYLMRRGGDNVPIAYRLSWLAQEKSDK